MLRANVNFQSDNWDSIIPQVQGALNSSYCSTIGESPHFALYGHDRRIPDDIWRPPAGNFSSHEEFVRDRVRQAREIHVRIGREIERSMDRVISQRNKATRSTEIPIGSSVMLRNFQRRKTDPRYVGPFRVTAHDGLNSYEIVDSCGRVRHEHADNLKPVYTDQCGDAADLTEGGVTETDEALTGNFENFTVVSPNPAPGPSSNQTVNMSNTVPPPSTFRYNLRHRSTH